MIKICPNSHPKMHELMTNVALDNGAVNRFTSINLEAAYEIGGMHVGAEVLEDIDKSLLVLSDADFETFGGGEHTEMLEIAGRSAALYVAHQLLQAWFSQGMNNNARM